MDAIQDEGLPLIPPRIKTYLNCIGDYVGASAHSGDLLNYS